MSNIGNDEAKFRTTRAIGHAVEDIIATPGQAIAEVGNLLVYNTLDRLQRDIDKLQTADDLGTRVRAAVALPLAHALIGPTTFASIFALNAQQVFDSPVITRAAIRAGQVTGAMFGFGLGSYAGVRVLLGAKIEP